MNEWITGLTDSVFWSLLRSYTADETNQNVITKIRNKIHENNLLVKIQKYLLRIFIHISFGTEIMTNYLAPSIEFILARQDREHMDSITSCSEFVRKHAGLYLINEG